MAPNLNLNQGVATFNAKLATFYEDVKGAAETVAKDLIQVGHIIEEDAPAIADGMRVVGAILAMVPGMTGAGVAMGTAAAAIDYADHLVVTAEGIAMKPSEAAAILGVETAKALPAASPEQKRDAAVKMVTEAHGVPANTADVLVALAYAKKAKIEPALPKKQ